LYPKASEQAISTAAAASAAYSAGQFHTTSA
jgi:hypothetical protein